MAIENYVNQILDSPAYVFDDIIEKLIGNNIQNAKIEMLRYSTDVDNTLFEAIKSVLSDLRAEEGVVSRFFYNMFGIELRKNKRREQLILLGSQLKTQHAKVKSELFRIYRHTERLSLSIVDLKRLEESFRGKNIYFQNEQMVNKSNFFIVEINEKIILLQKYQANLESKHNSMIDIEKIYNLLFKKIPRYHELQEENYLHLLPLSKKKV
jgi:hypothetical protein